MKTSSTAAAATSIALFGTAQSSANDFTAAKVMKDMKSDERVAYIAGVVEGLAVARYNKDGKKREGMTCVYDWFYQDKPLRIVFNAFDKYPDYPPGAIIDVLVRQKCGD